MKIIHQSQRPKSSTKTSKATRGRVTRRGRLEKQRELNETLAALFQFAPDATLLVDADGCIAQVNKQAETLFGYTRAELVGKKIEILVPARFVGRHVQHRAHYAGDPHRREMGAGLQLAARRKDGTEFPVDIMLSPLVTPDCRCVIATVRDITDRKRIEQALTQAHADLESRVQERTALLAQANEELRKDTEQQRVIIDTQREIARPDQDTATALTMIARRTQELTHAEGVAIDLIEKDELASRYVTGMAAEQGPAWLDLVSGLTRNCLRDQEFFQCDDVEIEPGLDRAACQKLGLRSIVLVVLYRQGPAAGVLKLVSSRPHAFGEREVAIARLMAGLISSPLIRDANQKADKLASLAALAAGVAHEIRNPLTAIKARLYTQQKRLAKDSPEAGDGRFINEEIDRLERIVRDFLQFAHPGDPLLSPLSPAALLREVHELLAAECRKSSIRLTVSTAVKTPVLADGQQLKQVLINLVQNAAESIKRDGQITLRARLIRVSDGAEQARDAIALEVEDTGGGISPEVQARLFDPFFTTKPSGTGLGLAIARRIVAKHGGRLRFETGAKGTVFRIVLPVPTTE